MQVFIGLDGGGSTCRAQAALSDGRCTQVLTGGAANVFSDLDTALREIESLLDRTFTAAQEFSSAPLIAPRITLGLAGVSESGAAERLRAALRYSDVSIFGDVDISLWGAFREADGIVLAVGTGSVLACQEGGEIHRMGGYGFMLGDEGSGAWIGREALRRTLHAHDGLEPRTELTTELWERFGGIMGLIGFAGRARPADYATLAPIVLAHDRAACPIAGAILDQGCAWLLRGLQHLLNRAPDMPVAPLGGLGPVLLERIMSQGAVQLNRVMPKGTALDGALWKARQCRASGDQTL